jgi:drug/metabolite transporter (DMT)-like permease
VAVFINGIPVVTAIGAWFILGESLTLLQMAGGLLVLIAVIVANKPQPSRQTASG